MLCMKCGTGLTSHEVTVCNNCLETGTGSTPEPIDFVSPEEKRIAKIAELRGSTAVESSFLDKLDTANPLYLAIGVLVSIPLFFILALVLGQSVSEALYSGFFFTVGLVYLGSWVTLWIKIVTNNIPMALVAIVAPITVLIMALITDRELLFKSWLIHLLATVVLGILIYFFGIPLLGVRLSLSS